jgi:hypothetical protein
MIAPIQKHGSDTLPRGLMHARVRAMTDDKHDIKTYSLAEVAEMVLPPDMTNRVRWLSQRLNRGQLSGYRVGRTWRMTRADVEDLIERHRNRALKRVDGARRGPTSLVA